MFFITKHFKDAVNTSCSFWQREKIQRRRLLEGRLKDDRGLRRERDLPSENDGGTEGDNGDDPMYDTYGGQGVHVPPFGSEAPPPPILMPVPGAG